MDITTAYAILSWYYGSHTKAAKALRYSRPYYSALRSGRYPLNSRIRFVIINASLEIAEEHPEVYDWLRSKEPALRGQARPQNTTLSN